MDAPRYECIQASIVLASTGQRFLWKNRAFTMSVRTDAVAHNYQGGRKMAKAKDPRIAGSQGVRRRRFLMALAVGSAVPLVGAAGNGAEAAPGPITGQGVSGRFPMFTGQKTIGNSVVSQKAGKVGVGTHMPRHLLSIDGGPAWTTNGWAGSVELKNGAAIAWQQNDAKWRFGIGHTNGGLYFFRTQSQLGRQTSPAVFDMGLTDNGDLGVGVENPVARVHASVDARSDGTIGILGQGHTGVWGGSFEGDGVRGTVEGGKGVHGLAGGGAGVQGDAIGGHGVIGISKTGIGISGESQGTEGGPIGVYGKSGGNVGIIGTSPYIGIQGTTESHALGAGVRGENGGSNTRGWAGYFHGRCTVQGNFVEINGATLIDHPLDPANRYLSHAHVISPDMKTVYDGIVTTDAAGEATVRLPAYFGALNREFRYQLTPVGGFAHAAVTKEISGNQFNLKTDRPRVKVCWQVTGIRKDRYALAYGMPVEQEKRAGEKGLYQAPELYGEPKERGIGFSLGGRTPDTQGR
jgi:hypothetical protein